MDISITLQSLLLVLLFSFLLYLCSKNQQTSKKPTIYGLRSYPIIGHFPHLYRNSHRFLDWITEILVHSPTHTMGLCSIGSTNSILTANPANVEHMLKVNSNNYPKGERVISIMKDFLGHGIFNSDGEDWERQRKTAIFVFNKKSLRNFVVETVNFEISNRLLPILNGAAEEGVNVQLQDVLERFAFDNICRVVTGEDPACLTEDDKAGFCGASSSKELLAALSDAEELSIARFFEPFDNAWRIKKFLNTGIEKRLKKAISIVQGYAMNTIHSHMLKRTDLDDREDILSRFASNESCNEVALRDAVISFLVAGRESSSTVLTWFFWLVLIVNK